MHTSQTILIHTEMDVIAARMRVREMARELGMNVGDQTRISLASSSLAHALGLGVARRGQMSVDIVRRGERTGLRVVCVEKNGAARQTGPLALGDTRWMVDECAVEKLPSDHVQVTLIKWMA